MRRVTSFACATMSSCWSAWARSMAITTSRDCRCSLSADVCASCWGFCGWTVQRRVVERYLEVGICWIKGQGPLRPIRAWRNAGLVYDPYIQVYAGFWRRGLNEPTQFLGPILGMPERGAKGQVKDGEMAGGGRWEIRLVEFRGESKVN